MRTFLILLTSIISLILLFFFWALFFGSEQYYVFDPMIDTETSSEYTKEKFDKIKTGMDSLEVKSIIGEPLYKSYEPEKNNIQFQYTNDGALRKKDIPWYLSKDYAWYGADIYFDTLGFVIKKNGRWVYD